MPEPRSVKDLFHAALEVAPAARDAWLDRECGGDAELRQRIALLLSAHDTPQSLLDRLAPAAATAEPATATDGGSTVDRPEGTAREEVGTVVAGRYKLLEEIGEGGMGTVWMAQQTEPVKRMVAVKLIKPGMDSKQVLARFEAERQALALMDHPNIARVLDAGTTATGRPFFVMELVKGAPITRYYDEHRLTPQRRLELFAPVCHAIQHAHQKGIIHRDVKPSNVLVALYDGQPVPKVIDFGIAKATGLQLTEKTLATGFGAVVGTLEYMSPEQAELNQLDIDTRSDVYSLGVLLYELLTGTTPLDRKRLKQAAMLEMLRLIREEEPPRPSMRLSESKQSLPSISAQRQTDPAKLTKLMRGELDWIVMKALEKDRDRRYETANGLAQDVQRYLADEPVHACPPSFSYKLRRLARRNKSTIAVGTLVTLAMVVAIIALSFSSVSTNRAYAGERKARGEAERSLRAARQAVDDMYTQVAEKWLAQQPQLEALQREFLQKALRFYTDVAEPGSDDPAIRLEAARALRRVAEIQYHLGQRPDAFKIGERVLERLDQLVADHPNSPEYRQELALSLHKMGGSLASLGRDRERELVHRRGLKHQEKLVADFPEMPQYRHDLAQGHWFLARNLDSLRRRPEAVKEQRRAIEILTPLVAEFPSNVEYRYQLGISYLHLGQTYAGMAGPDEQRQALGEALRELGRVVSDHPGVPEYRAYLAAAHYWLATGSSAKQAEDSLSEAIKLQEKLAADFPVRSDYRYDLMRSLEALGESLLRSHHVEAAEKILRRATEMGDALVVQVPTAHYYQSRLALVVALRADALRMIGKWAEAESEYKRSIRIYTRMFKDFPNVDESKEQVLYSHMGLVHLFTAAGRLDEARDTFKALASKEPRNARQKTQYAWLLATSPDPALRDPRRAVALAELATVMTDRSDVCWMTLGMALYRVGDWKEARTKLEKSLEMRPDDNPECWLTLAMTHARLKEAALAQEWYKRAAEWIDKNRPSDADLRRLHQEAMDVLSIKPASKEKD
jgi:tetratricopeptide (TPR) repeat protein/tRNA A-37 threonylcarbamoyl transferase component Bud32